MYFSYVVLILDLVNILQGVLIFVIMICRRKVIDLFKAKYLNAPLLGPAPEDEMKDTII